jgi:hypothetical protein
MEKYGLRVEISKEVPVSAIERTELRSSVSVLEPKRLRSSAFHVHLRYPRSPSPSLTRLHHGNTEVVECIRAHCMQSSALAQQQVFSVVAGDCVNFCL